MGIVGSSPTRRTNKIAERQFFCGRSKQFELLTSWTRKGSPIFLNNSDCEKMGNLYCPCNGRDAKRSNPAPCLKTAFMAVLFLCAGETAGEHFRVGLEARLSIFSILLATKKSNRGTDRVTVEKCTHGPTRLLWPE